MLQILFQQKKKSTKVHTIKISFRCNYKPDLKKKNREENKTERKARREGKRGSNSRKGNKGAIEQ